MNIFDDRYKKLSLKELNEQEKNNILSTYSDIELEFIISELYKKIINQVNHKTKKDKQIMCMARVYAILIKEKNNIKNKKLEKNFE